MGSSPSCPYCDAAEVRELAGHYGLWKCRGCGERFELTDDEDGAPQQMRTKFKSKRYGEDAW